MTRSVSEIVIYRPHEKFAGILSEVINDAKVNNLTTSKPIDWDYHEYIAKFESDLTWNIFEIESKSEEVFRRVKTPGKTGPGKLESAGVIKRKTYFEVGYFLVDDNICEMYEKD